MRAIILASGMGTRLMPLTVDKPKCLVEVNGKPLIERQIECLKEKGINDIIVTTGYLSHKLDYLKNKYGVKLVYNDKYEKYNNIYTMYLVRNYLRDCYVIESDIYLAENFIIKNPKSSTYFGVYRENFNMEWLLKFDKNLKLNKIERVNGDGYIICGVCYLTSDDADVIIKAIEQKINHHNFETLYWDDIVIENVSKLNVFVKKVNDDDVFEIDSIKDLEFVKKKLSNMTV